MERAVDLEISLWRDKRSGFGAFSSPAQAKLFVTIVLAATLLSALLASWIPLQFSIVTVFLFAGPHNYFEFRYFLTRLPVRFGKSRNFFLLAFAGILFLTLAYLSLPALYYAGLWSGTNWPTMIAAWNTLMLLWVAALVWSRGKQRRGRDWFWAWPIALVLISLNWMGPELCSLGIVYLHPLIALWFLDRQLRRTRPEWLPAYHRCLALLPFVIVAICWRMNGLATLQDDNGLAWRITQHAGAGLLPNISSNLLVSVHVFLEMLHYLVWLVALPLLTSTGAWDLKKIPLVQHPRGFPRLIAAVIVLGLLLVALLWLGFGLDYGATRDLYFAVAIAHVLAEAPFLLRTM
ncbi:MAG TPA: hypothetical protein VFV61_00350 [Pyrinomonadaceae bacterium]|nr:hypothetical protein [Pyrinomonadaceae bacterium]